MIENPLTGERMSFRSAGADDAFSADVLLRPYGPVAAPHLHEAQEERVQVLAGRLRYRLGRHERPLGERQAVTIPAGVPHVWWNDGDAEAHVVVELRPARDAAALFERLYTLAREGRTDERGVPGFLTRATLARRYGFFSAGLPLPVQRTLFDWIRRVAAPRGGAKE